jgi:hypothetical protein
MFWHRPGGGCIGNVEKPAFLRYRRLKDVSANQISTDIYILIASQRVGWAKSREAA